MLMRACWGVLCGWNQSVMLLEHAGGCISFGGASAMVPRIPYISFGGR